MSQARSPIDTQLPGEATHVVTLQTHILSEERRHPEATGTLSWILSALSISAKMIASQIRRARLEDVLGSIGSENVQGEDQQKLDVISNEILVRCLGQRSGVAIVASEEDEEPMILRTDTDGERRYCVQMFVLDPAIGAFLRVEEDLRIPAKGKTYSLNEGNRLGFPQGWQDYLAWAQESGYSGRYVGAMVADVHRTLLKGGVFMYPPTEKAPNGKLRLMYEANPMAMLVEQAGGKAFAGADGRILEVGPETLHQRVPVLLGSADEVDRVREFVA